MRIFHLYYYDEELHNIRRQSFTDCWTMTPFTLRRHPSILYSLLTEIIIKKIPSQIFFKKSIFFLKRKEGNGHKLLLNINDHYMSERFLLLYYGTPYIIYYIFFSRDDLLHARSQTFFFFFFFLKKRNLLPFCLFGPQHS